MKLVFISDSHFDENHRLEECIRVHQWLTDEWRKDQPDLILHGGDVYERRSTPTERKHAADFFQEAADIAPVVVVKGNHDAPGDIELLGRLRSAHPIHPVEGWQTITFDCAQVHAMAWPRKEFVLADAHRRGYEQSLEESEQTAQAAMRFLLTQASRWRDASTPQIFLSHMMIRGSLTSHGQPMIGTDLELALSDLAPARADFYALGHVHKPQEWTLAEPARAPVVYSGSPRRTQFGELEEKSYVLASFDESGTCWRWARRPIPCRQMIMLEGEWDDTVGGIAFDCSEIGKTQVVKGAEMRLRYKVPFDKRGLAETEIRTWRDGFMTQGAVLVKVEEQVIPEIHARAPEIAEKRTLGEKLQAYWEATDAGLDEERQQRLLTLVGELQ